MFRMNFSRGVVRMQYWALSAALLSVATGAFADDGVGIEAHFQDGAVRAGETAVLVVAAEIPDDYHLYSMTAIEDGPLPLRIDVGESERLRPVSEWFGPRPTVELDPNFNKAVEYFSDRAVHSRAYRLGDEVAPGNMPVSVSVKGQICNDSRCIPFKENVVAALSVEEGAPRPDRTAKPSLDGEAFGKDRAAPEAPMRAEGESDGDAPPLGEGFVGFLLLAFLAGLGALVTPCVFPMIPITVSFFSKFSKVSMRRSVSMASIYAGSIIFTFTLVGVAVSAIFGAVGMQTLSASVGFNIFLTLLLVVFAFNLFGLFEIQMPSWLVMRSSEKERALSQKGDGSLLSQAAGVFFMAVTFTLVSFTCTVGFIGVVLAEASKGNWFYPAVGMAAFSTAFSLPFFFLAVFPSWAEKLRGKGGDWMVAVKVVLGFLELASAFKFLSNVDLLEQWGVVSRPMVLTLWTGLFAVAGLYLLRVFNLPHSDPDVKHISPIRMFFAMLLLSLAAYSASGIRDTKSMGGWLDGWLPPAVYPGDETSGGEDETHLDWIVNDMEKGRETARAEGKPLFVDFTGYTCTNCRYMEGAVFPKESVKERLQRMVRVSAYTDCDEPVCEMQREYQVNRFDTAALPFYAILDPFTDAVLAVHPDMSKSVEDYVAFLDKGLAAYAAAEKARNEKSRSATGAAGDKSSGVDTDAPGDTETAAEDEPSIVFASSGTPVDFTFPSLDGKGSVSLSALRGKWVLLNFWASWCAPCKKELKEDFPAALGAISRENVQFVTVAFDGEDTVGAARKFAEEAGLYDYISLQGGEDIEAANLPDAFEADPNLPLTYLIHPDGYIAWKQKGVVDRALLGRVLSAVH